MAGTGMLVARTTGAHGRFEMAWLVLVAAVAIASHGAMAVALRALPITGDAAILLHVAVSASLVTAK